MSCLLPHVFMIVRANARIFVKGFALFYLSINH